MQYTLEKQILVDHTEAEYHDLSFVVSLMVKFVLFPDDLSVEPTAEYHRLLLISNRPYTSVTEFQTALNTRIMSAKNSGSLVNFDLRDVTHDEAQEIIQTVLNLLPNELFQNMFYDPSCRSRRSYSQNWTKKERTMAEPKYQIKVYVDGQAGYFTYEVGSKEKACSHAMAIMKDRTYRRVNDSNEMDFWPVYRVKVTGPGLDTEYPDEFVRT